MAVRAILFSAVGTAGQRCTSLRRLIAHESVKEEIVTRLKAAYSKVRIGHPLEGNLIGPLIDKHSFENMQDALESFYSSQADVYDVTRSKLLKGREDMLALAAAQLLVKAEKCEKGPSKRRIWVDVRLEILTRATFGKSG